ncbi:MAG: hypothetical protein ACOY0R_03300 [Chloroflexota bacterium]
MNMDAGQNDFCPFLGLRGDPHSLMLFISPHNCCHRCKPVAFVNLEHQNDYCLAATHINCPVYSAEADRPLPRALRLKHTPQGNRLPWMAWLALLLLLAGALAIFLQQLFAAPALLEPTAAPAIESSVTPPPASTPTLQPTPTASTVPSLTPTQPSPTPSQTPIATPAAATFTPSLSVSATAASLPRHALEVPIGRGQQFLIHRVLSGENLNTLAETYQTSIDAILAVNYDLAVPIWADTLVVLPLETASPQGLPILEPYQLSEAGLTAETLAQRLGFDLDRFNTVNDLAAGETLNTGDWFLIPRDHQKQP